jgi:hypothetical protein
MDELLNREVYTTLTETVNRHISSRDDLKYLLLISILLEPSLATGITNRRRSLILRLQGDFQFIDILNCFFNIRVRIIFVEFTHNASL